MNVAVSDAASKWVAHDASGCQRFLRKGLGILEGANLLVTQGGDNVPKAGGFILAANHGSHLDDLWYMAGHDRTVRLIANHESLEIPVVGEALRLSGRFPVEVGNSAPALADARGIIKKGEGVMWFPEGERHAADEFGKFHSGFARVALETGAPVVPAVTRGNKPRLDKSLLFRVTHPPVVTTAYGEPIETAGIAPTEENVQALKELTFRRMVALQEKLKMADDSV